MQLRVPLQVKISTGATWGGLEPYTLHSGSNGTTAAGDARRGEEGDGSMTVVEGEPVPIERDLFGRD